MFRYYSKFRPVAPGTVPKGFKEFYNFPYREYIVDVGWCWGWVEYDRELSKEELHDYELTEMGL